MDIYNNLVYQKILSLRGIKLGAKTSFIGSPIISKVKDSNIELGEGVILCSRPQYTALGCSHPVVIRAMKSGALIKIGDRVRVSGLSICAAEIITIGDRCVIGSDSMIVDTDFHSIDPAKRSSKDDFENAKSSPVVIGNDVFIGANCAVLKGSTIGNYAVIGANSVVTKDVPEGTVFAGNPAKKIANIKEVIK
ncbi:Maltose O-acetyltransferase [Sedimentisphaera cyanobacteriorum]|uniref:Maltose O-acetyltransferase n=1 Tax=Sedimentisphaera cyanobacteriorum TaxID=1940790 RepID=A0A1Q2HNU2_9BACT|nr:acyltransferase [Sedimentisphaera cyanobacteriorum]AQQ09159.1 Maltose O-acetyltransferase [Sedimentisphaera cyanobacteriorum]